ncbi:MAG: hypothetical protein COY66_05675 [Candidatus Kerfeldbacteria bacterium CG_4_10_14_0_8_um_filter_42_10]|uniref:Uncharacterized protein n=1 Tax=Candidatus Kerfeldbacteria bacterium CG_4_10_14_0_8_um_filter_42_10 TaxID=2014248 RepID=A0A2M7RGN6_9BACT|nr:MAG: hypothetical protein COY66_05675 [Candidatus Kerfeldbacteria bacterium CG_4_10_14_0_8_um_filter_42_10]
MRLTKYIRIDETPRRVLGNLPKLFLDTARGIFLRDEWQDNTKNNLLSRPDPIRKSYPNWPAGDGHWRTNSPEGEQGDLEIPPYLLEQILKTNNLVTEFNTELEQRGVAKIKIEEFRYDSYKIGLKIAEGIILQFNQPWMASRQFDLAQIHAENTIITLQNFREERIGSAEKIAVLEQHCRRITLIIRELKQYFDLDQL